MPVAPVDVEAAVCQFLGARTSVPTAPGDQNRRANGIRVVRVGGDRANLVQSVTRLTIECWESTEADAFVSARRCWARLANAEHTFVGSTTRAWLSRVELTDPVNLPDTDAKRPRYQFIAQLTVALDEIKPQEIA